MSRLAVSMYCPNLLVSLIQVSRRRAQESQDSRISKDDWLKELRDAPGQWKEWMSSEREDERVCMCKWREWIQMMQFSPKKPKPSLGIDLPRATNRLGKLSVPPRGLASCARPVYCKHYSCKTVKGFKFTQILSTVLTSRYRHDMKRRRGAWGP